jgi:hypothetical protein
MVIGSKKFSSNPIRVARIDNGHGKAVRVSYRLFPSDTQVSSVFRATAQRLFSRSSVVSKKVHTVSDADVYRGQLDPLVHVTAEAVKV